MSNLETKSMQTKKGILDFAEPKLRQVAEKIDCFFVDLGCTDYVKTIYVGYEINGEMVAALYPHPDHLEIALSLDETFVHPLIGTADHLSWRTLPVSAVITKSMQFNSLKPVFKVAFSRVLNGNHAVSRDNEYFRKKRGSQRGRIASGRSPKVSKKVKLKKSSSKIQKMK